MAEYRGILFIGDTHLASRTPNFRKDDYPRESLKDFQWCLDYARKHKLLPAVLGDLFHWPRDNANWLLNAILETLSGREVISIYGNHDCQESRLTEHDSLMVLARAGALTLLDGDTIWRGKMQGQQIVVGGTSWGQECCADVPRQSSDLFIFWMTHHDWLLPGYEEHGRPLGKLEPKVLRGAALVVNGHIHRPLADYTYETSRWLNPGSVARVKRDYHTRNHKPTLVRVNITETGWSHELVPIPHKPFEEIFHATLTDGSGLPLFDNTSAFIQGLAELQARRTDTGAALGEFLDHNLGRFPAEVAAEIRSLAEEVLADAVAET
jgi:DNA repair exonuclease SbcCD nuclease subunit